MFAGNMMYMFMESLAVYLLGVRCQLPFNCQVTKIVRECTPAAEACEVGADADSAAGHQRDCEALIEAFRKRGGYGGAARQALHPDAILISCTCMHSLRKSRCKQCLLYRPTVHSPIRAAAQAPL